jgi:hypothetical protein
MIAKHLIRMASTRAKARALRDMCNIGIACLEELSDFDDVIGNETPKKPTAKKTTAKKIIKSIKDKATPKKAAVKKDDSKAKTDEQPEASSEPEESEKSETTDTDEKETVQPKMSEAQKRAIYNLSRRRGISVEELEQMAMETYSVELESLSTIDASAFIRNLQQAA